MDNLKKRKEEIQERLKELDIKINHARNGEQAIKYLLNSMYGALG